MRVLHVSDTHLGIDRWFLGAPRDWRRRDDHHAALRRALAPALREGVQLVVHSGDLFDRSRPPAASVAEAAALLFEVARRVPTIIMPGNHDRHGLRHHFADAPPGLRILDGPECVELAGLRLGVVPFHREPEQWAAAAALVAEQGVDVLIAHQAFDGSRVPGFTFRPAPGGETLGAQHLPRGVGVVLNGHIHTRQNLRIGDAVVHHVGSTERTSWVERGEAKAASIWEPGCGARAVDTEPRPMMLVETEEQLGDVMPGALVGLGRAVRTQEVEQEALRRGGWVAPWRKPSSQLGLFG